MIDKRQMKRELIGYARTGIDEFLKTSYGQRLFPDARATFVNATGVPIIQVECRLPGTSGLTFFELSVTEKVS